MKISSVVQWTHVNISNYWTRLQSGICSQTTSNWSLLFYQLLRVHCGSPKTLRSRWDPVLSQNQSASRPSNLSACKECTITSKSNRNLPSGDPYLWSGSLFCLSLILSLIASNSANMQLQWCSLPFLFFLPPPPHLHALIQRCSSLSAHAAPPTCR